VATEQTCEITQSAFGITEEEIAAYEYFDIPLPTVSPEERCRRQLGFRNSEALFWRNCDQTSEKIFSTFPATSPFPVVDEGYWFSDEFDATSFSQKFDFKRLFVEQLLELWIRVPRPARIVRDSKNVVASHGVRSSEGAYFLFDASGAKNCLYSVGVWDSSECVDCYYVRDCSECYESIHCRSSSKLRWCESSARCHDSWFLSNCEDCSHCLFCTNLKGKEYHIFNKPVSPEAYAEAVQERNLGTLAGAEDARGEWAGFLADQPLPHIVGEEVGSSTGNFLYDCTSVFDSFECSSSSNVVHCHFLHESRDCLDGFGYGPNVSRSIQFVNVSGNASRIINCVECWDEVHDLTYCSYCTQSSNLFCCVGLKGKEYCIFNKQYSKDEYEALKDDITRHLKQRSVWGKFFPANFSGYPYNLSSANVHMPLSKVPAKMLGFTWDDKSEVIKPSQLLGSQVLGSGGSEEESPFDEIPQRLADAKDSAVSKVYLCEMTGRPFRLTKDELALHRRLGVALPTRAFEQRHQERVLSLSPRKMQMKKSEKSGRDYRTAFPDNWRRPVLHSKDWERAVRSLRG